MTFLDLPHHDTSLCRRNFGLSPRYFRFPASAAVLEERRDECAALVDDSRHLFDEYARFLEGNELGTLLVGKLLPAWHVWVRRERIE